MTKTTDIPSLGDTPVRVPSTDAPISLAELQAQDKPNPTPERDALGYVYPRSFEVK